MVMIVVILLNIDGWRIFELVLIGVATALTVISLCDYIIKNKEVLGKQK
jgi:CDP-diacylglycerol--glycerol-3-phosphate 3-phosphatidyltransferase